MAVGGFVVKLGGILKQHFSYDLIESGQVLRNISTLRMAVPPSPDWDSMFATKSVFPPMICFYVSTMEAFLRWSPPRLLKEISPGTSATSLQCEVAQ